MVKSESEDHARHNSEPPADSLFPTVWVKCEEGDDGNLETSEADVGNADLKSDNYKQQSKLKVSPAAASLRSFRNNKERKSASDEDTYNPLHGVCSRAPGSDVLSFRGQDGASQDAEELHAVAHVDNRKSIVWSTYQVKHESEIKMTSRSQSRVHEGKDSTSKLKADVASRFLESRKHEKILDLSCPYCSFTTNYRTMMTKHKMVHKAEGVHYCPQCDMSTRDTDVYRSHLLVHHERDSYTCDQCDYTTLNQVLFTQHINKHTDKSYSCVQCSYKTGFRKDFQYHQLQHSAQQVLKCNHCSFVTKYQHNFKQHVSTHTGKGLYFCHLCSFFTAWDRNFSRHMTKHKLERTASLIEDSTSHESFPNGKTEKNLSDDPKSVDAHDTWQYDILEFSQKYETGECTPPISLDELETIT